MLPDIIEVVTATPSLEGSLCLKASRNHMKIRKYTVLPRKIWAQCKFAKTAELISTPYCSSKGKNIWDPHKIFHLIMLGEPRSSYKLTHTVNRTPKIKEVLGKSLHYFTNQRDMRLAVLPLMMEALNKFITSIQAKHVPENGSPSATLCLLAPTVISPMGKLMTGQQVRIKGSGIPNFLQQIRQQN